jgi:N-methylhydantoinase B
VEFLADTGAAGSRTGSPPRCRSARTGHAPAIAEVPDGTWTQQIEADGFDDQRSRASLPGHRARRSDAHRLRRHLPQVDRGINCVMNYTHAYSVYPVKCALDPFTPRNEGSYQAITVSGAGWLHPQSALPRAVFSARQLTGHLLAGAIYKALARSCRTRSSPNAAARRPCARCSAGGARRRPLLAGAVRLGRHGRLPASDGLPTTAFPTNVGAGSIEAYESVAPLHGVEEAAAAGFRRCRNASAAASARRWRSRCAHRRGAPLAAVGPARPSGAGRARRRRAARR